MKNPLNVLKRGLKLLKDRTRARREALNEKLSKNVPISTEDEEWLDTGDGNLVEEELTIEALEKASDYEQKFESLDSVQREVVRKLREAAGDLPAGKKRKSACLVYDDNVCHI